VPAFRCSVASADDGEPLAATAPTETRWLLVEQPADWAPKVPLTHPAARVQLVRRPGGGASEERDDGLVRVFHADLAGERAVVRHGRADPAEIGSLDPTGLELHDRPLLLVCTHGRRDVCCAERGRPVAAALAARWPEETWETTHLGGHRFAATLLALPSGVALGRLDPATAVDACAGLLAGRLPRADVVRGRAGRPGPAQAAEAHLRHELGLPGLDDVVAGPVEHTADGDRVTVRTPDGTRAVQVVSRPGSPVRQSCGDDKVKAPPTYVVRPAQT
jgi:hypothetical protein